MPLPLAVREVERRSHEVLGFFEDNECRYDADGLGVWVGVRSLRPEQLLKQIKRLAFPDFSLPGMQMDEGRCWTWFRIC